MFAVLSLALFAAAGAASPPAEDSEAFLAKATLQQYLSGIVRKDWDAVRRLTHPRALQALAPWAGSTDDELKTFRFKECRSPGPGIVIVGVAEDVYHPKRDERSTGAPAVYVLFRRRSGWAVGDKKPGAEVEDLEAVPLRASYPGWVDREVLAEARRTRTARR
jgi:hypothetical protein